MSAMFRGSVKLASVPFRSPPRRPLAKGFRPEVDLELRDIFPCDWCVSHGFYR